MDIGIILLIAVVIIIICTLVYGMNKEKTPLNAADNQSNRTWIAIQKRPVLDYYNRGRFQREDSYIVLDVETSGLDPAINEVIQIAAVKYIGSNEPESFVTYVKPKNPISPGASFVNHIFDYTVRNAPSFSEIQKDFLHFIGDLPIVGYNVGFDMKFINTELGFELPNWAIDVLPAARRNFELPNYKLETLKNCLDLKYQSHDALGDCFTTNAIYQKCLKLQDLEERLNQNFSSKPKLNTPDTYHRDIDAIPPKYQEMYDRVIAILGNGGKDLTCIRYDGTKDEQIFKILIGFEIVVLFRFSARLSYCLVNVPATDFHKICTGVDISVPSQVEGGTQRTRVKYENIDTVNKIATAILASYDNAKSCYEISE